MTVWSSGEEENLVWLEGRPDPARQQHEDFEISWNSEKISMQQIVQGNISFFSRPAIPYSQIIRQALEASPRGKLLLKEIYMWFESFHPYYTQENKGWKVRLNRLIMQNSVRHTLSANKQFLRLPNEKEFNNKGSEWCLVDSSVGQAYLRGQNSPVPFQASKSQRGNSLPWAGPLPVDCALRSEIDEERGPLKRSASVDLYWSPSLDCHMASNIGCNLGSRTPDHLLGITPNPDFALSNSDLNDGTRLHKRSMSMDCTPCHPNSLHRASPISTECALEQQLQVRELLDNESILLKSDPPIGDDEYMKIGDPTYNEDLSVVGGAKDLDDILNDVLSSIYP